MSDTETPPSKLTGSPATDEQKAWHAYRRSAREEEPKRLEEAAKFLAGMISITFTIFLSADREVLKGQAPGLLAIAALVWVVALLLAFLVLFPRPYGLVKDSAQSIEQAHDRVVRWKIGFLGAATIAYLIALVILAFVFVGTLWGGS